MTGTGNQPLEPTLEDGVKVFNLTVDPIKHQMEHFGAVVRGEAEPLVSLHDGTENLRITEAIVEAARSGRVVATRAA